MTLSCCNFFLFSSRAWSRAWSRLLFRNRLRMGAASWSIVMGLVWRYGLGWNIPGLSFGPMLQGGQIINVQKWILFIAYFTTDKCELVNIFMAGKT